MRVATYNILHAAVEGPRAIASVLRTIGADLIALQEVDAGVARSGGIDQAAELAAALGMESAFGPALSLGGGSYGVALLSRWPIRDPTVRPLPSLAEPRTLLVARVETPAGPLSVAVTHFGLDPRERMVQARVVREHLRDRSPLLLCGDFNATRGERPLEILAEAWIDCATELGRAPLRTYPSHAPTIAIDHVWRSRDAPRPLAIRTVESHASDHLPVVVDLG